MTKGFQGSLNVCSSQKRKKISFKINYMDSKVPKVEETLSLCMLRYSAKCNTYLSNTRISNLSLKNITLLRAEIFYFTLFTHNDFCY